MIIFNSYVSLPEGIAFVVIGLIGPYDLTHMGVLLKMVSTPKPNG